MKKRQQVIYNWSIIIINITLYFIPAYLIKKQNGYACSSLFSGLLYNIKNIEKYIMYPFFQQTMTVAFVYMFSYIVLCIISIIFIFKKKQC